MIEAGPENMQAMALVGRLLTEYPRQEALALFEQSAIPAEFSKSAPDNLATLRSLFDREPQAVTAALLTRISADGPGVERAEIARLAVPALVIGHERDLVHPFGYARALAELIPGATLCRITPKAEDLDRHRSDFRESLRAFLRGLADRGSRLGSGS
jgi:pimeloyl-ACP methyl ester carboxylesterase